jgi:hypothetical protein
MKLLIVFSISAMLLAAAEGQSKKNKAAPAKTPARAIQPVEIPKGAVETVPGTYRFTDAQGKKWLYRKTPFGVARWEDIPAAQQPAQPAQQAEPYSDVRAFEDGESIHFERPGPFGAYKWTAKKSELNEMERKVWDREKTKSTGKKE